PALFDKVRPRLRTCNHAAGEVLFRAGDKITNVHFWETGAVSLVLELATGEMIESAMVGRDSIIGGGAALNGGHAVHKAIVQVAGSGSALDVDTVRQIARDSEEFRIEVMRHEQL